MARENGFIITLIVNFILFLSLIPIVFNLTGNLALFELILIIILLIISIILMSAVARLKTGAWKSFFIFYAINLINELFIYFKTFRLSPLILPFMVTFLGFLIDIIKIKSSQEEDFEIEPYKEPEEKPIKTAAKKTAKKRKQKKIKKKITISSK